MLRKVLHGKIHMATVTAANPDYVGSITIGEDLLEASGMRASDAVLVANCRNGARFETYILRGERNSRRIEVNGAAAHNVEVGDRVLILHFALMDDAEYAQHHPQILVMNENNTIARTLQYDPT